MIERERIWNLMKSLFPDEKVISVDELLRRASLSEAPPVRQDVIQFFNDLNQRNLGLFIVGRRGRPSRILLGRTPEEIDDAVAVPRYSGPEMVSVNISIRPGVEVKLTLPRDLTSEEADSVRGVISNFESAVRLEKRNPVE